VKKCKGFYCRKREKVYKTIEEELFSNNFEIAGEKLKNVPKKYDKDHKYAEYLKHKSWDIECYIKDSVFLNADEFIKLSVEMFKHMKPFNDFLNRALKDFKMPERK
jgi:hypothetical protein